MDNFFKYTTKSSEDKNWGLYLNVAGYAHILSGQIYPPPGHPQNTTLNGKTAEYCMNSN